MNNTDGIFPLPEGSYETVTAAQEFDDVGRGYWNCPGMDSQEGGSADPSQHEERHECSKDEANLVSSLCRDGQHRPVLDIDFPATVDSDEGHFLIRFERNLMHGEYVYFSQEMAKLGFGTCSSTKDGGVYRAALYVGDKFKLVTSTTPGHFHLYIDRPMSWEQYRDFLEAFSEVKLLENGYVSAAIHREATFVRPEWVHKPEE